jgi:hypothetical protein
MTHFRTLIISALFVSCSDYVGEQTLLGRYVMSQDTLELLPDKTFRHVFNGITNIGTWKFDSIENEVAFDNYSVDSENRYGVWHSRVILTGDEIHMNVNSDISNGYYNKVKDK